MSSCDCFTGPVTGDVLLFSNWSSQALSIKLATASCWNHVGIAVWLQSSLQICPQPNLPCTTSVMKQNTSPELYCFETNNNSAYDGVTNREIHGCRLTPISLLKERYTHIAYRSLNHTKTPEFERKLWEFIQIYLGQPYHQNKTRLIRTALEYPDEKEPESRDTFCSQLTAKYLQYIGLLEEDPPAVSYLPRHFSFGDRSNKIPESVLSGENIIIHGEKTSNWTWPVILVLVLFFCWIAIRNFRMYTHYKFLQENLDQPDHNTDAVEDFIGTKAEL